MSKDIKLSDGIILKLDPDNSRPSPKNYIEIKCEFEHGDADGESSNLETLSLDTEEDRVVAIKTLIGLYLREYHEDSVECFEEEDNYENIKAMFNFFEDEDEYMAYLEDGYNFTRTDDLYYTDTIIDSEPEITVFYDGNIYDYNSLFEFNGDGLDVSGGIKL